MAVQVLDRKFKPLPWSVGYGRVRGNCRWAWRGLVVAWPMWGRRGSVVSGGSLRLTDPITGNHGTLLSTSSVASAAGRRGNVLRATAGGSVRANTASALRLPTTACTVVYHYRKTDAINRATGAFGIIGGTSADLLSAHLPYSDGTVYWDFGGNSEGTSRKSVGGLTFGDDVWVFTSGPRGMEIWQNGFLRGSNGASPTRTNANTSWGAFTHSSFSVDDTDSAESGCLLLYNHQWSHAAIRALSIDPWTPFRPARRMGRSVTTVAAIDNTFIPYAGMYPLARRR